MLYLRALLPSFLADFALRLDGFLSLILPLFDSQFQIILINLPNILVLSLEVHLVTIHKHHFVIIPKLDQNQFSTLFSCNFSNSILKD